jgi:hypothetical protein
MSKICGQRVDNESKFEFVKKQIDLHLRDTQMKLEDWTALVDEFSIYIYILLVGGLCALASEFLHVLIMINLVMVSKFDVMGLLPLQFTYMMSRYRCIQAAGPVMFAKVISAYGSHLVLCEDRRMRQGRGLQNSQADQPDLTSVATNALLHRRDGEKIKVGVFAPDVLQTHQTVICCMESFWAGIQESLICG